MLAFTSTFYDSRIVSRQHAEILYIPKLRKFFIRDLGSALGTFVNGDRLSNAGQPSLPREITSNDVVQLGENRRPGEEDVVPNGYIPDESGTLFDHF